MALTDTQRQQLLDLKSQGVSKQQAFARVFGQQANQTPAVSSQSTPKEENPTFMQDARQDRLEMGQSLQETLDTAGVERRATRDRVSSGEIGIGQGAFQTIGQGLLRGGEFLGKAALGLGKMVLPQSVENRINETLGEDLRNITDPQKAEAFIQRLESSEGGLLVSPEVDKQTAQKIRDFNERYSNDPNFASNINATLGFTEAISALITGPAKQALTPESPTPKSSGSIPVQELDEGTQIVPIRTAAEANERVLSQYGEAPQMSPIGAAISGAARQIGDFAGRTVKEAQDVAATEQRLSSLPEPEANIRRLVADERVIDLVNNLTPEEIAVTNRLVDQAKLKQGDITPNTNHPKVIAGEELLKPVQHIIDRRKSVGAQLGELRKQLGTEKNVNTNSAFRSFHTYLKDNYRVQFDKQGNIIAGTGTLGKSDVPVIQDLYNELRSGTFMSQRGIDEFLQRSYKDYDLKQTREQTFSDEVSRIAERARTDMRQLMPDQYNGLATKYAEMSKPLVDMVKLLGYKGNLDELSMKDLKAGEVGMRILGNAADRPQSVINGIVDTAGEYGYKSNVNLNNIITLADQLDSLYDITPQRSFAGQVSRGIDQSGTVGALGDAATMNVGGLYNRAMSSRASQDEIREAFENYIQSKGNQSFNQGATLPTKPATGISPEQGTKLLDLSKRLRESSGSSVPDYLRNNKQAGFANFGGIIPQKITPQKVASMMDDQDFDIMATIASDIDTARTRPEVNKFLDDVGVGKANNADVEAFLKRTTDEYEKLNPPKKGSATPQTTSLEEAKYGTASLKDKYPDLSEAMFRLPDDITVYRGSGKGIGNSTLVKGEYWADSKEFAETFGEVTEETLPKNAAVLDLDIIKDKPNQTFVPKELLVDQQGLTDYLVDRGIEYTKNTNTRGVEFVKLNKIESQLRRKASTMNQSDFKKFVMDNYDTYRSELARISGNYTQADRSRMRSPIDDIWKQANQ